ncbi:ribosomal RNA small subunit methyltransferase A [candidate division WOR-3 bacterium]|uniref:Ribosomal RNA small subunit methyltransferase A n=1 Tax=candidate division WOR-3 bacterium TaxID=2052148 RepID=A0A9D5K9F2_UNCW3|nr:ribosomal RNA small subunit methyltransferase A [candidate division WOR-3 bacterium]MBD3364837.1 ribosomal RNA small subunit methyltransferase A [candidate division WOR-3 bacterium]
MSRRIIHVHPKKGLGQHFLRSKETAARIVDALRATDRDMIIEVGAGTGELTRLIIKKAGKVVAVEVDEACFPTLEVLADLNDNLELFLDDVRRLKLSDYPGALVLGNLPYHLSAQILFWLIEQRGFWKAAVLTVQAEFADRLAAAPGSADYSALSVVSGTFLTAKKIMDIPASAFKPRPRVTSSTVRLEPKASVELPCGEQEYIRFVRSCFAHRRKTLVNNLKMMGIDEPASIIRKSGYNETVRPQELSADEYIKLCSAVI